MACGEKHDPESSTIQQIVRGIHIGLKDYARKVHNTNPSSVLENIKTWYQPYHVDMVCASMQVSFWILLIVSAAFLANNVIMLISLGVFVLLVKYTDIWTWLLQEQVKSYQDKVIWVTGASTGIGLVLCKFLAIRKPKGIIMTSRSMEHLKKAQTEVIQYCNSKDVKINANDILLLEFDVAKGHHMDGESHQSDWKRLVEQAIGWKGQVDMVFCNAGRFTLGTFPTTEVCTQVFDCNFFGTTRLIELILPHMKKRGTGNITITNSVSAYIGVVGFSAYAASKSALLTYSQILRQDLRANGYSGIHITSIHPGAVHTNILHNMIRETENDIWRSNVVTGITAEQCASSMLRATSRNLEESWIAEPWTLLTVYVSYYLPNVHSMIRNWSANFEMAVVMKAKGI